MDIDTMMKYATKYGMRLVSRDEARTLKIGNSGSELFAETYSSKRLRGKASQMSPVERELSFLNRWFVLIKQ